MVRHADEGDLFPRNSAPDATPRIKKRNGDVLFHPLAKRIRVTRTPDDAQTAENASVTAFGSSLTFKRLCEGEGMTVLALVVQTTENSIRVMLPSGIRAEVDDEYIMDDEELSRLNHPVFQKAVRRMDDADNKDDESQCSSEDDEEDHATSIRPLWKLLQVGQVLPVAIVSAVRGSKNVKVSLKPHLVNAKVNPSLFLNKNFPVYGSVLSIEDHGYVLSFGSNISHSGFLPFENCDQSNEGLQLHVGTPLRVVTEYDITVPKTKRNASIAVRVSAHRERVNDVAIDSVKSMRLQDLVAGMLIRARVTQEGPGGLSLLGMGMFQVDVDGTQVPCDSDGVRRIGKDKSVAARILFVDPASNLISGTLLESLVTNCLPPDVPGSWKTGTLLKPLKVQLVRPKFGLSLRCFSNNGQTKDSDDVNDEATNIHDNGDPDSFKNISIFASVNRVTASKLKLESKYQQGTIISKGGIIVNVSKLDGVVNVDIREEFLSRKALSIDEIELGSTYDCKIAAHSERDGRISVFIEGDPRLPGFILHQHTSDVPLPPNSLFKQKAFRIGATLKCVALCFLGKQHGTRLVSLSARNSLVFPHHPLLTSVEDVATQLQKTVTSKNSAEPIYCGTVVRVTDNLNLLVSFCRGIMGTVSLRELAVDVGTHPEDLSKSEIEALYPTNQTISVRVTSANPNTHRLHLSTNLNPSYLKPGDIVKGCIVGVNKDLEHFLVSAEVPLNKKVMPSDKDNPFNSDCILPFQHICDVPAISKRISSAIVEKIGTESEDQKETDSKSLVKVDSALVLTDQDGKVILTMKDSLKKSSAAGRLPLCFNDICKLKETENQRPEPLFGYVKSIQPRGAIIGFLGHLVGFLPLRKISNSFVSDAADVFCINQSVTVIISDVDQNKSRFVLSSKPADVGDIGTRAMTLSTFGLFSYWRTLLKRPKIDGEVVIGSNTKAIVKSVLKKGARLSISTSRGAVPGVALKMDKSLSESFANALSALGPKKPRNSLSKTNNEENLNAGEVKDVRVLDVDPLTGIVDLTFDDSFVSYSNLTSKLRPGETSEAKIVLVKKTYVVLLVLKKPATLAFSLIDRFLDPLIFKVGTIVSIRCLDTSVIESDRNIVVIEDTGVKVSTKPDLKSMEIHKDSVSLLKNVTEKNISNIIGIKVIGRVLSRYSSNASVAIDSGVKGHLHISNCGYVSPSELENIGLGELPEELASRFELPKIGSQLNPAFVTGIRQGKNENKSESVIAELALTDSVLQRPPPKKGLHYVGFVIRPSQRFDQNLSKPIRNTAVMIDPSTHVVCEDVDCLFENGQSLSAGMPVKCHLSHFSQGVFHGILSSNGKSSSSDGFYLGIIKRIIRSKGILVQIPTLARTGDLKHSKVGLVHICDISKDYDETIKKISNFKVEDVVHVRYLDKDELSSTPNLRKGDILLSMKDRGRRQKDTSLDLNKIGNLKKGSAIRGFVSSTSSKGCFVNIGRNIVGHVMLRKLSNTFLESPEKEFPPGKLVVGRIESVSTSRKGEFQISMVLKPKGDDIQLGDSLKFSDLKEGDVVNCVVKTLMHKAVILRISRELTGLLHVNHIDSPVDVARDFVVNQRLTCVVVSRNEKKVELGTKRAYFEATKLELDEIDKILETNDNSLKQAQLKGDRMRNGNGRLGLYKPINTRTAVDENGSGGIDNEVEALSDDGYDDSEINDIDQENVVENGEHVKTDNEEPLAADSMDICGYENDPMDDEADESVAPLKVEQFDFNDSSYQNGQDEEGLNNTNDIPAENISTQRTSKDKREKKRLKEKAETETRLREEALARNDDVAETAEDFERLVIGEPNSSILWIRYMGFCVGLSQIEKARSIAERAIDTISVEQETERLNVWIAYVNLEAQFGNMNAVDADANDSLGVKRSAAILRVFERGCQRVNNEKSFYMQVASALSKTDVKTCEVILRRASKKFRDCDIVWTRFGEHFYKNGDANGGRECLEQALMSLPKSSHTQVICKFAQYEYKYGSVERGRTVLESLVGNFAKRVDLWSIYLDMEERLCQQLENSGNSNMTEAEKLFREQTERTRRMFERFTSLELRTKKMKFAFTKWLEFEKKFGSLTEIKAVKAKAKEYVNKKSE